MDIPMVGQTTGCMDKWMEDQIDRWTDIPTESQPLSRVEPLSQLTMEHTFYFRAALTYFYAFMEFI